MRSCRGDRVGLGRRGHRDPLPQLRYEYERELQAVVAARLVEEMAKQLGTPEGLPQRGLQVGFLRRLKEPLW